MISEAAELIGLLSKKKMTLSLAESCTGGVISGMLTDVPGASEVLIGSVVAYSNASKEKILGVPHNLLERCGAVSEEVAKAMAEGAKKAFASDIAASATGIAGPGGGTLSKPVGTVFIAATDGRTTKCERLSLKGTRSGIRNAAAGNVIRILRELAEGRQ